MHVSIHSGLGVSHARSSNLLRELNVASQQMACVNFQSRLLLVYDVNVLDYINFCCKKRNKSEAEGSTVTYDIKRAAMSMARLSEDSRISYCP